MAPEQEIPSAETQPVIGYIKDISSVITAITGLVALLGAFATNIQTWIPPLKGIEKPVLGIIALALLSATASIQRKRLTKQSELLQPHALDLDPQKDLVGREEDVRHIKEHVNNSSLVWLVGDSGAGKSALLTAGAIPTLRKDGTIVIYVSDWGSDWIDGPRESLASAANVALLDSSGTGHEQIKPDSLFSALGNLKNETGRTSLLIFDQFDDY